MKPALLIAALVAVLLTGCNRSQMVSYPIAASGSDVKTSAAERRTYTVTEADISEGARRPEPAATN